jgi:hypothetical protein
VKNLLQETRHAASRQKHAPNADSRLQMDAKFNFPIALCKLKIHEKCQE